MKGKKTKQTFLELACNESGWTAAGSQVFQSDRWLSILWSQGPSNDRQVSGMPHQPQFPPYHTGCIILCVSSSVLQFQEAKVLFKTWDIQILFPSFFTAFSTGVCVRGWRGELHRVPEPAGVLQASAGGQDPHLWDQWAHERKEVSGPGKTMI